MSFREYADMPSVMIRRNQQGQLTLYVAKKDLEDTIVSLEFDAADCWGGEVRLNNGSSYYIEPLSSPPQLPLTLRARRTGDA